ncbi:MAG: hypothetical protein QT05_C0049G0037 [archaeon GW2011_AR13]|nr:MAG: hypothetical protein QT05_C0049G0037 [archaeon GW2011_AR13]HIG94527.1 hypothetical protein [Nanoarchaeota archaeon]HIH63036.1 hypothetical protein [Nanoarchaeota archaeon]HIJ09537.1 hypothetical protein [Nanoarchaeota archaeon]
MNKRIEEQIRKEAECYMAQSRPNWNIPHLYAAVFYMKELINNEGGNPRILLPTIYFHDIGYAGMLKEGYTFKDNDKVKILHMQKGAKMSKTLLAKIGKFSNDEIEQIAYLISIHDNLKEIKTLDAQKVFEADSLAQIDFKQVPPNFNKENFLQWFDFFNENRIPLFKTQTGKNYLTNLLPLAKNYYN